MTSPARMNRMIAVWAIGAKKAPDLTATQTEIATVARFLV